MNPTTQKLLDASESLATPMLSTNQASQHTPPQGYWFNGDRTITLDGNLVAKAFVGCEHATQRMLDKANSQAELLAALERALPIIEHDGAHLLADIARAAVARATQS